ncbi:MAG TPA: hypothetical protein VM513_32955 [Kofleriaceae bacterium]|jgi:hypothetical protein|nr:hypothetical protein [Kofleriaceae bacterium]
MEFHGLRRWSDLGTATAQSGGHGGTSMSNFVETWKGIATALGRSERWCRYMARRAGDPLPVFKVGGIVRLNSNDLEDWLSRQRERSMRVSAPAVIAHEDVALRLIA